MNNRKFSIPVFLTLYSATGFSAAEPKVDSVEGNFEPGSVIHVNGTQFGEFNGRIISWDDFEGHDAGLELSDIKPVMGVNWTTQYGYKGQGIVIDDSRSVSGKNSVKVDWSIRDGITAFGWENQSPIETIYISYQRYMIGDYKSEEFDNHKQFYLFGTDREFPQFMPLIPAGQDAWAVYNNSGFASSQSSGKRGFSDIGLSYDNTSGKFQRWEWFLKLNDPIEQYNGIVYGWVDGAKAWDISDYRHRYVNGTFDDFRLGHMASGFHDSAIAWFDDVYSATTPARVELCGVNKWSACGNKKVLLIPMPDIWQNERVSAQVPELEFDGWPGVYLYVVDSHGAVNEVGFDISEILKGNAPNPPTWND